MPNATAVIGSRTRLRDGSNRVLAMITKGSITGSLISANQLPPMTRGISNEPTTMAAIGKRISDRAYLTFSRSLNTTVYDQIILLEYDASDRLSWILSRNEDQSYALEFRVRHVF